MQAVFTAISAQMTQSHGESRRLFHGRGGCFPGLEALVIDWFDPVVVVRLYDTLENTILRTVFAFLQEHDAVKCIVLQQRSVGASYQNRVVYGVLPEDLYASELGLRYRLDVTQTQNAGLFLDMRKGRTWLAAHAQGKNVLNLFSYTCAFSVVAVANGAANVVNVDMSKGALTRGRANHHLNALDTANVRFYPYNIFKSWGKIGRSGPYDVVIIDPPSFQRGSFIAEKDYRRIICRLETLCCVGASVLLCHNDPTHDESFVRHLMADECPNFTCISSLPAQADFPEKVPEHGVKAMVYRRLT